MIGFEIFFWRVVILLLFAFGSYFAIDIFFAIFMILFQGEAELWPTVAREVPLAAILLSGAWWLGRRRDKGE